MTTTINKTIGIGDAGLPFNLSIDVEFEQQGNLIIVTDWMEDASPYDNPPDKWWDRMKEIIADFFYDQNEHYQVQFQ
jgi:hypothetical protein